jgi:hypothetical protein
MWVILFVIAILGAALYISNRKVIGLVVLIVLATSGFQIIPLDWYESPLLLSKPYDYAYFEMAIIFLYSTAKIRVILSTISIARDAVYFCGLVVLISIFSWIIFSYNVIQIIQSARLFLWPSFLLLFLCAEKVVLLGVVKVLFPITLICSFFYIQQPFTGIAIFSGAPQEWNPYLGDTDFIRVLSTPDFLIFFLLLAGNQLKEHRNIGGSGRRVNWAMIIATSIVQILSFTRSTVISTVIALGHSLSRGRTYIFSVSAFAVLALSLGGIVFFNQALTDRFSEGIVDLSSTLSGGFETNDGKFDGNLSFRIGHLYERATYILDDPSRWLIGIGMIHEESQAAVNLGFRVGLLDASVGRVVQVDSGDIAWSIIILKMGLLGVISVLLFLYRSYAYVSSSFGLYSNLYRGACLYYMVTSFFSNSFASPAIMMQLMLFLALAVINRRKEIAPLNDK